jgi:hypothetical protein
MSALLSSALPSRPMVNVGSGPASLAGWINIDGLAQAWFAAHPALSRLATHPAALYRRRTDNGAGVCVEARR